ncbi:hypothetical protein Rleg9DRAFT_0278 [Rhizobium leguminosarum bv. trifolii WSM597]|uniref:Uncharacterized protein n=1 Tax=Rhizobium leguminosarum bv. trifolii WSM597 TaxID=754764 RepID=I9WYJ1_RHILT|nr:hypothetical protein [Rhizobium leguminosarum]EJB01546.1 hypothetical protein Rleg9DRAFT_0278 [Rhizobium leguminosarum bv. trifolii WSM597]
MTTPIILSSNANEAGAVILLQDAARAGNASFTPDGSKATFVPAANNLAVLA